MYCIWLTFDSPDLMEIIIKLAQKYDGPVFLPHCTLVGKIDSSLQRMESAIINLMSNYKSITVHPLDLAYSDYLWRSLYFELKEKQILTYWHGYLCDLLSIHEDTKYLPHISLMYNDLPLSEKKAISNELKLRTAYKIRSVQIVECNEKVDDWKPVFEMQI